MTDNTQNLGAKNRIVKIAYLEHDKTWLTAHKASLESHMSMIIDAHWTSVPSINAIESKDFDIMVLDASRIPETEFSKWLESMAEKIQSIGNVWIPALIFTMSNFEANEPLLLKIVNKNWYFDIIHPDHLDSLPIRIANLGRIHDHLRELLRYNNLVTDLATRVEELEAKIKS